MSVSKKPQQSISLGADHLHALLRVDQIRTDTLVQLVAQWAEPDVRDEVIEALDELAAVVQGVSREGERDAALEQVEDVAGMETAQVEVGIQDSRRLMAELTEVMRKLNRFRSPGASEITHPAMRPTRAYLAENPLPEQQDRRAS
jgi:hypothetical protein